MFRTDGDRIKSTGSNGIPTQHKTSPEAWEQPGNTVLTIQWLGSDTLRALYRISVCTYIYFFLFGIFKYKFTYVRRKMRT